MLVGFDRRRLQAMTENELRKECRKLSRWWLRQGSPDETEMPRLMLVQYIALQAERRRRGDQLELF